MPPPLVVKLGGDALASPERIVAAARRLAERRRTGPVVAVASARRGVTDHLLELVDRVRDSALSSATAGGLAAADRAALRARSWRRRSWCWRWTAWASRRWRSMPGRQALQARDTPGGPGSRPSDRRGFRLS